MKCWRNENIKSITDTLTVTFHLLLTTRPAPDTGAWICGVMLLWWWIFVEESSKNLLFGAFLGAKIFNDRCDLQWSDLFHHCYTNPAPRYEEGVAQSWLEDLEVVVRLKPFGDLKNSKSASLLSARNFTCAGFLLVKMTSIRSYSSDVSMWSIQLSKIWILMA